MKVADGYSKSSTVKSIYHYKVSFFFYHFTFLGILNLACLFLIFMKSKSISLKIIEEMKSIFPKISVQQKTNDNYNRQKSGKI